MIYKRRRVFPLGRNGPGVRLSFGTHGPERKELQTKAWSQPHSKAYPLYTALVPAWLLFQTPNRCGRHSLDFDLRCHDSPCICLFTFGFRLETCIYVRHVSLAAVECPMSIVRIPLVPDGCTPPELIDIPRALNHVISLRLQRKIIQVRTNSGMGDV